MINIGGSISTSTCCIFIFVSRCSFRFSDVVFLYCVFCELMCVCLYVYVCICGYVGVCVCGFLCCVLVCTRDVEIDDLVL